MSFTPNSARIRPYLGVSLSAPEPSRSFHQSVHRARKSSASCGRSFPSGRSGWPTRTPAPRPRQISSPNPAITGRSPSFLVLLLKEQLGRSFGRNAHHASLVFLRLLNPLIRFQLRLLGFAKLQELRIRRLLGALG